MLNLIEYKCLCCNKNYQKKFDENLKNRVANKYKFVNHDINKLICCCKKVFIDKNTWIIERNSMRHHYQEKKIFIAT